MCMNWKQDDEVVVVYPSGTVRYGTITRMPGEGRPNFTILFFQGTEDKETEQADPNVKESWLRVPGDDPVPEPGL